MFGARIGICITAFALAMGINPVTVSRAQAEQAATARNRVVIQVSDADLGKWNLAVLSA